MMKPDLIKFVRNGRGRVIRKGKEELLTETMRPEIARKICSAMTKAGDHYDLTWIGDKDYRIAAKTGTAQRGDGTNNAWLVTFAPADNPKYVIVVCRLKTKKIGKTLAPVAEALYERLLYE
jgi:peptidoglycan glycosyltransferase